MHPPAPHRPHARGCASHVRRTASVLLAWCCRCATLRSVLPWRRVLQSLPALAWGPETPVSRAGAPWCPWKARRTLYQHVGNFVGSVISPLLAHIALHGLEHLLQTAFPRRRATPVVIRYAEDLVVIHEDRAVIETCQQLIAEHLAGMGLELKPRKTRITHTLDTSEGPPGCDFLGFTIRQYRTRTTRLGCNSHIDARLFICVC